MVKVVINRCFGGFSLSDKAIEYYAELKGLNLIKHETEHFELLGYHYYVNEILDDNYFNDRDIERDDPDLIRVVEELGTEANGRFAKLGIVEIPDDVQWCVEEYDGWEHVAEVHRTWG